MLPGILTNPRIPFKENRSLQYNGMVFYIWALIKSETILFFFFKLPVHFSFSFFLKLINLFIYFWLCWVFVSVRGLSLVAASGGHSSSRCAGLSLQRPLLLRSTGSRRAGSVVVAHGPSCSAACGIFPDQGSNPCPLHQQADSQPLRHQGSPETILLYMLNKEEQEIQFWKNSEGIIRKRKSFFE